MEDKHDKESNEEYAFLKEQPITDYDLDTLFFEHDKTKVSEKARKEFIKENSRVKADIRKGLTGDDEVAATNWKGFPTPRKRAIDKKGELIPRTSPVYKTLDLEDEANMITNRLTVPKNTPMTPRFQMDEKEWKDGAWRLLPTDSLRDLKYMMAKGGPAVMGIPVPGKINPAKKSGGRRKKRKKKTRKKRGGSPLPPVPYDELKITLWNILRNNGDRVYDMKNKKNNKVDKVRITKKFIETRPRDEHYGKKMIQFQRVYQVLDGSLGRWAVVSGRYEGYTPYADHTGPWTYSTPYDDVVLTKHISPAKTGKLAVIGVVGGRRRRTRKKRGGDKWESARKQEKKKYCKKYYKGKYGINKKGCKKDPMCKYVDMGSGGEWCYTKKRKYKKKKRKTRRKKRKTRKR